MLIKEYQEFLEKQLLQDKRIKPHTFIFTKEHCLVVQLEEQFDEDIPKEVIFNTIAEFAGEKKAYRVIFISEVWYYKSEEVHTKEEVNKVLEQGTDTLEQQEGFQIIEITKHNISLILRSFKRIGDTIELGKENAVVSNNELLNHSYKCIQDNLVSLM